MARLGEAFGGGFARGSEQGTSQFFKERAAKLKAAKKERADNIRRMSDFVSAMTWKRPGTAFDDPENIKDRTQRATMAIMSWTGQSPGPQMKARIDHMVRQSAELNQSVFGEMMRKAASPDEQFDVLRLANSALKGQPPALFGKLWEQGAKQRQESRAVQAMERLKKHRTLQIGLAREGEERLSAAAERKAFLESPAGILRTALARGRAKTEVFKRSPVSVEDKRFLGLPSKVPLTQAELIGRGINVPSDPTVRSQLQAKEGALRRAHSTIVNIIKRVEGHPEVLGAPGAVTSFLTSLQRGAQGFINLIPALRDFVVPDSAASLLDEIPGIANLGKTAKQSAIVKSLVIGLTYQAGAIAGQTARALSDKDYEAVSKQIAAGIGNDRVMVGVLRSFAIAQSEVFAIEFLNVTGVKKRIGVPDMDLEDPFGDLSLEQLSGVILQILPMDMYDKWKDAVAGFGRKLVQ